jgi:hypothetical protein
LSIDGRTTSHLKSSEDIMKGEGPATTTPFKTAAEMPAAILPAPAK